ncbi:MAG: 7-carboxy-7-deazaguanine synthase [Planctomycetota bacterium]|jgi:7-carboxy-7-deazaguanine synthase (Cx14CxxC type)|nr:7-carboxy-7-deazaguanine synthase [Planctomycetota bacterium]MDP6503399.1 7-carboxy-7-deazaguanine synthase [Planctomycetota bacterium]
MYSVKEIYFTIQGEGRNTGQAAVFLRFTGCNLWSGLEADRAKAACQFCDTDFVGTGGPGGGVFSSANELAQSVHRVWQTDESNGAQPYVVCTGGEPLIQMDQELVDALRSLGFTVAIETNGTLPAPSGIDWLCVSPKAGTDLAISEGTELKLVFPQEGVEPAQYERFNFKHFYLQPMDGPQKEENTRMGIEYCKAHPTWRLSLQTHKILGLP